MCELHNAKPVTLREKIIFQCEACGACCKNVRDSVMLEPYDTFRLTRHLRKAEPEITIEDVLMRYCEPKPLSRGYIIYVLKTVDDSGVCAFLQKDRCGIYDARPRTCRLYPFTVGPGDVRATLAWYLCTERQEHFKNAVITPREWKRKNLSREEEGALLAEFEGVKRLAKPLRELPESLLDRATALTLFFTYANYELREPFLRQYQRNIDVLEHQLALLCHAKA